MTDAIELQLANRFGALANEVDDSDWLEVGRRARRRRRRWLAVPIAALVAALAVGSALGVYGHVVDFFSAEPAPDRIVREYGQMSVLSTIRIGPRVLPSQARKVMEVERRGRPEPFYVAPTADGGFCYRWGTSGSCGRVMGQQRRFGGPFLDGEYGPAEMSGTVLDGNIARLRLEYEDGDATNIPIVWVSQPIAAGFYAYEVPAAKRLQGHGAGALVALDDGGDELERIEFHRTDPRWESGPDGLPRIADRTQKRTLFDLRAHDGSEWTLVTAPAPGDKLCYAYNGGGGCLSPKFPASIDTFGGVQGGSVVNICCALPDAVTAVELEYEDGERQALRPVDGFLLYVIPPDHYPRGHRVERLVFRDTAGRELGAKDVDTDAKGIYPCAKSEEIDLGYGAKVCP
jgi:hypothetical protein